MNSWWESHGEGPPLERGNWTAFDTVETDFAPYQFEVEVQAELNVKLDSAEMETAEQIARRLLFATTPSGRLFPEEVLHYRRQFVDLAERPARQVLGDLLKEFVSSCAHSSMLPPNSPLIRLMLDIHGLVANSATSLDDICDALSDLPSLGDGSELMANDAIHRLARLRKAESERGWQQIEMVLPE